MNEDSKSCYKRTNLSECVPQHKKKTSTHQLVKLVSAQIDAIRCGLNIEPIINPYGVTETLTQDN